MLLGESELVTSCFSQNVRDQPIHLCVCVYLENFREKRGEEHAFFLEKSLL